MTLKHDAQGFLVGDPIDLSQAVADWKAIRDDVRAIRRAVIGIASGLKAHDGGVGLEKPATVKVFSEVVRPRRRDDSGRRDSGENRQQPERRERQIPVLPQVAPRTAAPQAAVGDTSRRDAEGAAVVVVRAVNEMRSERRLDVQRTPPVQPRGRDILEQKEETGLLPHKAVADQRKPVTPQGRDKRGRFASEKAAKAAEEKEKEEKEASFLRRVLNRTADRSVGIAKEAVGGLAETDPAVKAFTEVAQPMARGFEILTGGSSEKKREGLLRRIANVLTGFRKENKESDKKTQKTLKNIEKKQGKDGKGGKGLFGGLLGMLGGLLRRIPGVGALMAAGGGLLGGGLFKKAGQMFGLGGAADETAGVAGATEKAGAAAKGVVAKRPGILGKAGGLLKKGSGLLRRIPVLGALLGGIGAASDIHASEMDDTLTRREKDRRAGNAVGGFSGSLGGMFAGAKLGAMAGALGGPIGAAIGGVVGGAAGMFFGDQAGQIIGEKAGGWISDLRDADIPGKIVAAWDNTVAFVKDGWQNVKDAALGAWESVKSGWDGLTDSLKAGWGSFVDTAKAGWDFMKETVSGAFASAYEGLKSLPGIGPAVEKVEGAARKTTEFIVQVVTDAKEMADSAIEKVKGRLGDAMTVVKEKAVKVGAKAVEGAKAGVEYLGEHTTAGKIVKATGQGAAALVEKAAPAMERAYDVTVATTGSALEAIMPKGYRHKALFDGIDGGGSLTKNGSYTNEEAARIRYLKTNGANTSANVKGGMSLEVRDKIFAQAKKSGLDPVMMQKIAAMESGGNANAISSTGAIGIYQFTGKTASGVGIKNRFDVDQNIEGGMKLTQQNQAVLEKAGLPVTAENLYMMHQLGPKAAQEVIRGAAGGKSTGELSADTRKAMSLNYGKNSKTAADYIVTNKKALDDRYAAVTKDTGSDTLTTIARAGSPGLAAERMAAASPAPAEKPAAAPVPPATTGAVARAAPPAMPDYAGPAIAPVVASVRAPSVPAVPSAPAVVAESPPVAVPMASNNARQTTVVVTGNDEVGQDLRERGIAHIVTGGLSGA